MNNVGKEIISAATYQAEVNRKAAESIDLSLIFNRHADAADAERSVSQVEPDSVVFIEGYPEHDGGVMYYEKALGYLTYLRLGKGKNDPEYMAVKQAILEDINSVIMAPVRDYGDYSQYSLRGIQLLLENDCIIQNADYVYLESEDEDVNEKMHNVHRAFRSSEERSEVFPSMFVGVNANIAKSILGIYKYAEANTRMHYLRESYAKGLMTYFFTKVVPEFDGGIDLNITSEGKMKAYVIYGSAHKKSLSHELSQSGFSFDTRVVDEDELKEWMLIPETGPKFVENISRRVALTAIRSLSDLSHSEIDVLYEKLEVLNDDADETLKFLIRCIQIGQQADINVERANKWLDDLKREVLG